MRIARQILLQTSLCVFWAVVCQADVPSVLNRPATANGAEATTLVIYSETRVPYSLADSVAALKLQLRRVASRVEAVPVGQVDTNQLAVADYVVVFCPQPFPVFPLPILKAIVHSTRPVLWVGFGADQLARFPGFSEQFEITPYISDREAEKVSCLGRERNIFLTGWLPVLLTATNITPSLSAIVVTNGETASYPISWKVKHVTFFAMLPTTPNRAALFSELLLDFYGVEKAMVPKVGVRIDGYHCHQDHLEFRHLVDSLNQRGVPFILGVIPAYWNPQTKKIEDLDSEAEFVAALRYAQSHGGRLILQGYVNTRKAATGLEPEFWDVSRDQPLPDNGAEYVRERVQQGLRQMLKHNLFPLGWMTPFNAASRSNYAALSGYFSTAVERVQLSDATALENFAGTAVTQDDFGRLVVPENLGMITGQKAALVQMLERATLHTQLRGTVSVLSFPAYLTDDKLVQAVRLLDQLQVPFLDLADGDHWVQLPEAVLLTGNAQRTVTLQKARIHWKAFNRAGKLLAEEAEPELVTGPHLFERRGNGDYELFQIIETKP